MYYDPRWRREWPPCCKLRENFAVFRMFYLFFLLFYVVDVVSITVYDRDMLLNIGSSVAQCKPNFEFLNAGGLFTDMASEPFVWVVQSRKRRRRRKRAGVLVRLRRRAFRPPLPTILLANVQSLDNKLCELRARISYQQETRDCCVICLTETWMSAIVPDSTIELTGFSVHRSDRAKELTGKSRGGGVCFYINNSWCNERNIHSIKSFCSPDLEFHTLLCRPFWLPREFTAIIITAVYIHPQANTDQALRELYGNISEQETAHPDAAFIITGDFNKANFRTIVEEVSPLTLSVADVTRSFKRVNICKAVGPDVLPGRVLKACAFQLPRVFTDIFNLSLSLSVVPSCFKKIHHCAHTKEK